MASEDLNESHTNHFYGVFMTFFFTLALITEECNLNIPLNIIFCVPQNHADTETTRGWARDDRFYFFFWVNNPF